MEKSACSLLSQIEQELCALRAQTVQNLAQKLAEREQQLSTVSSRYLQLKQDFEYNLQLLDGRDAELVEYEGEIEGLQLGLEEQGGLVEELQASLAKAQTDVEREQQLLQTAAEVWQAHHQRLMQEAAQIRQCHEAKLHSAAVQFEARRAAMLAELAEAQSKLESLAGDNARLHAAQASRSLLTEEGARQLAISEQSLAEAQLSCAEASARSEALELRREAAERELAEVKAQLERDQRHLQHSIADLEQARELGERKHKAAAAHLQAELDTAKSAAREAERKSEAAASTAAEQQAELRAELAKLSACEGAEREAVEELEAAQKEHQQLKSKHNAEASELRQQLQELQRRNDRNAHDSSEAAAAEIAFLKAKIGSLELAFKKSGSITQKLQEAQAALSSRDAELAALRAELAARHTRTPQAGVAARSQADKAAAAPPTGESTAAALRYSQISPGWDLSEPESPDWLRGPVKAAAGTRAFDEDASRQLRAENANLQAALEGTQEENRRLCAALATLSADMEVLAMHAVERPTAAAYPPRVADLERQLADAQRSIERLTAENERLMEISSELRSQRHKAERAAAQAGSATQQAAPVSAMVPVQAAGRPQYPTLPPGFFGAPTPGGFQPYGASPLHFFVGPHYLPPLAFPTPMPAQHDSWPHQQPTKADAAGGSGQCAGRGDCTKDADGDKGYEADVAQRLRRIETLAEEIALAQVHGGQNRQRIANTRNSRLGTGQEGGEDAAENAGVVGANMAAPRRERLRAMQQKAQAPKVPRVRNWNIIDDQEALA